MAQIYPRKEFVAASDFPYSEEQVYDALSTLDDDFTVFHSVWWRAKVRRRETLWRENDFLILNKKLGALVLEVKGGIIEYVDGVFHQTNQTTGEVVVLSEKKRNDPLTQARDGMYRYRSLLDEVAPGISDEFPIEAAVWFPGCRAKSQLSLFPLNYKDVQGAILDADDLSLGGRAIQNVFSYYARNRADQRKANIPTKEYKNFVNAIATNFQLIPAPGATKGALDHAFLRLTKEQMGLLDYISEQNNATIQGIAGTGKTLIAKEAARRFGEEGRKVLFLCFNKYLYEHLQKTSPSPNVTYFNINRFVTEYSPGTYTRTNEERATELLKIDEGGLDFDDVIIDEAQDFLNDEIIYFRDYAENRGGHFYVFYDKNQLLTTNQIPRWITESECRLVLTKNCRNTKEIATTSYKVMDIKMSTENMPIKGDKPTISFIQGPFLPRMARLLRRLMAEEKGYALSDLVILSLATEETSIMRDVSSIEGIPVSTTETKSAVFFTTASKFKGLERRVVIVVDIDEKCFRDDKIKRRFYVACSRATQVLALVITGDESKIQSIADTISDQRKYSPKAQIARLTRSTQLDLE